MTVLSVKNISKSFGNKLVLDDISFDVKKGDFIGLLGHNGSGKTTLISIITRLIMPNCGVVEFFGKNISKKEIFIKKNLGILLQEYAFSSTETVMDVLLNHCGLFGYKRKIHIDLAKKFLNMFGLWSARNWSMQALSGGQKRIITFIRVLITQPIFLILDEPTVGVDIKSRLLMWDVLRELNSKEEVTIFLTSHHSNEFTSLCKKFIVLKSGRIVGKPDSSKLFDEKVCYSLKLKECIDESKNKVLEKFLKVSDNEYLVQISSGEPVSKILKPLFNENIPIHSIEQVQKESDSFILGYLGGNI